MHTILQNLDQKELSACICNIYPFDNTILIHVQYLPHTANKHYDKVQNSKYKQFAAGRAQGLVVLPLAWSPPAVAVAPGVVFAQRPGRQWPSGSEGRPTWTALSLASASCA